MPDRSAVLAERYRDALIAIRKRVSTRVEANWRALGSWDQADVPRFLNATLPVVAAGQRRTVSLTDAYLSRTLGRPAIGLDAANLIGAAVRAGTDPATAYTRPFVQHWSALQSGTDFMSSMQAAGARASGMAQTDISLTMRASAQAVNDELPAAEKPWRWIRVPGPESCGLCVVAATQLYKSPDLQPIHDRCDCGTEPVSRDSEKAAKDRNRELLGRLKSQDSYTTDAAHLKRLRVDEDGNFILPEPAVEQHGELGLVLVDSTHEFSGPPSSLAA